MSILQDLYKETWVDPCQCHAEGKAPAFLVTAACSMEKALANKCINKYICRYAFITEVSENSQSSPPTPPGSWIDAAALDGADPPACINAHAEVSVPWGAAA